MLSLANLVNAKPLLMTDGSGRIIRVKETKSISLGMGSFTQISGITIRIIG